jgi:hypothetical protein
METPLVEVPSTVNVINRQQLDSQQLLTLPEALNWCRSFIFPGEPFQVFGRVALSF